MRRDDRPSSTASTIAVSATGTALSLAIENDTADDLLHLTGLRVRGLRNVLGISRRELAVASAVSERHIAQLELGRGNISIVLLDRIAGALQCEVGDLVGRHSGPRTRTERTALELLRNLDERDQDRAVDFLRQYLSGQPRGGTRIALVGLRGAGKSTLGQALAERRGWPFVHLRSMIEELAGMRVGEIFELSGQAGYSRLEHAALMDAVREHAECVIETSGNIVADRELYARLLSSCTVVWLRARPELHMQRVRAQGDLRPMADNDDAMSDLRRMLKEREMQYARAHIVLDTSGLDIDDSLQELDRQLAVRRAGLADLAADTRVG